MKKAIKRFFIIIFVLSISVLSRFFVLGADDLMYDSFSPAITKHGIIYIGKDKKSVGRSVLRESLTVGTSIYKEFPLIVRIVKVILKITVVLSVSMVIFSSVKFMIQIYNGSDIKSAGAVKDLKNILIGLLIALFSITAVNLVVSIPKNSLNTSFLDTGGQVYYI